MYVLETERRRYEWESRAHCICVSGVQTERRVLYMVMREEWRQNRGLVHRKCQTFNKNKVAGRAPITNSLNSRQTNPPQESRAGGEERRGGRREGREGLDGTERDKSISWQTILHLKVSTTAGNLAPWSWPHLSHLMCLHTVHPQLPVTFPPNGPITLTVNCSIMHVYPIQNSKLLQQLETNRCMPCPQVSAPSDRQEQLQSSPRQQVVRLLWGTFLNNNTEWRWQELRPKCSGAACRGSVFNCTSWLSLFLKKTSNNSTVTFFKLH